MYFLLITGDTSNICVVISIWKWEIEIPEFCLLTSASPSQMYFSQIRLSMSEQSSTIIPASESI